MAVKINSVAISPQSVLTGENITITVVVEDVSWGTIKNDFDDWADVKSSFTNWNKVLNYV